MALEPRLNAAARPRKADRRKRRRRRITGISKTPHLACERLLLQQQEQQHSFFFFLFLQPWREGKADFAWKNSCSLQE